METRYVVCDAEGNVSWSPKKEAAESFTKFQRARARAKEIAEGEPGTIVRVYELTAEITVPLKPIHVARKHPLEHYR